MAEIRVGEYDPLHVRSSPWCICGHRHRSRLFTCTRPPAHPPPHVAAINGGTVVAVWAPGERQPARGLLGWATSP